MKTRLHLLSLLVVMGLLLCPGQLFAQNTNPARPVTVDTTSQPSTATAATDEEDDPLDGINPFTLISGSDKVLKALGGGATGLVSSGSDTAATGTPGFTSTGDATETEAEVEGGLSTSLSILLLLTVLTLVPSILVMCTSFTRIVVVLALLRQALGTQSLPPTQVVVGLSLFLTFLVMAPTLDRINAEVLKPMQDPEIEMNEVEAWEKAKAPLRDFMFAQIDHAGNWDSVYMLMEWREPGSTKERGELRRGDVDMLTLVPAFMLSELKVAFLLGFRLYLPFLVIDMVISSVLLSMGMMMLPPVMISLPFKLLLFVLVDGWNLVVANLLSSFVTPGGG